MSLLRAHFPRMYNLLRWGPTVKYRIRKSQSSGKWYVVRLEDNALIAVSQPSIAAAMRLLRKFLK